MSHSYHKALGCLEIDVVTLYANVSIGAAGAPTLNTSPGSKGIASVTRNSAGNYTFVFDESFQALLFADTAILDATASNPTTVGLVARIHAQDVSNGVTPSVTVCFYNFTDGTAADPRNGAVVLFMADMRFSTVQ